MPPNSPQTLYQGNFLRIQKTGRWEYASRTNASGVVVILPLTSGQKIILIEQYRPACGQNVVGLPAGLTGDEEGAGSEELLTAAQRELLEETGCTAPEWKRLADGPSSLGLTDELITFFLADRATRDAQAEISPDEGITVWEIPLAELSPWLEKKKTEGCLIDYKIFAALYLHHLQPPSS